jgi:PAS domain S-box-containing protein
MVLDVLEDAGVPLPPLVVGLPVSLAELRDPGARVDWDVFAELLARVERACEGTLSLEEIGARGLKVPPFDILRRAGQLLMSPRQLHEVARRLLPASLFPNVDVRHEWLPSGRLVFIVELLPGYCESVPFIRICHGNAAALPRLLDLPASTIEEQVVSGRRGRLVLLLPPSHTLAERVRRGVRAIGALGETWRGIERHQQELDETVAAFRRSRHELQQLIERLPDGVLIQQEGMLRWANASLLEILGFARVEDVVGRSLLSFMPEEDREPIAVAVRRAAVSEVSEARLEYRILRPDGSLRRIQAGIAQQVDFDGGLARMVVLRDVTEEHRLREQAAITDRLASLGALAASVAHEINNPLSYVLLSLEVASREAAALAGERPDLRESLVSAREGTDRVLGIVRDLKMLSRVHEPPDQAVDLREVLEAALAVAERVVRSKARVVRAYASVPLVRGPQGKLGQVFLNLLTNAADAIPEGSPASHTIRVATHTAADGRAIVEIADTGSGIVPQIAPRVFDPFFTTKAVGLGTGLGLALCHRIITEQHGTIAFDSVPGATTFRVSLPAAASQRRVARPVGPDETEASARRRRRVLVVDDEPALLAYVGRALAETHEVVTASGGRAALEILAGDTRFDAVVTDLMMAGLTGMDLYEQVRAGHPGLERRFVFMTGGAFTQRAREFLGEMPNRCLEKPFEPRQLLDAVEQVGA